MFYNINQNCKIVLHELQKNQKWKRTKIYVNHANVLLHTLIKNQNNSQMSVGRSFSTEYTSVIIAQQLFKKELIFLWQGIPYLQYYNSS